MYLVDQLRSGCFDHLKTVENVVDCLFVVGLFQFLLHICILIVVKFHLLQENFFCFVVFQLLFFLLVTQVVCFY